MPREIHPDLLAHEFSLDDLVFPVTAIPNFEPRQVETAVQLTKRTWLKRPIIASPMDTVTESEMAILVAKMGGIGVIHAGLPIERQVAEILRVRRWAAGFVLEPAVLGPDATIGDVFQEEKRLGFSSYPITKDGTLASPMVGIITGKDMPDSHDPSNHTRPIYEVMTPFEKLFFATKSETLDKRDIQAANAKLEEHKLDTLPILDREGRVVALVTRSDIAKNNRYSYATKDDNNQLRVYAAVESRLSTAGDRIEAIASTGVSGIVIDSRNVYGDYRKIAEFARFKNPEWDIIVGNLVHPKVLEQILGESGALIDAFRVGIGTGEVCVTSEHLGLGRAMGSTLSALDRAFQEMNRGDKYGYIGFMADGGIKHPRHLLAASMLIKNFGGVMMGSALAGFDESPGSFRQTSDGIKVKYVRGMGSEGAIAERAGSSRYGVEQTAPSQRYAEGIDKPVRAVGKGEDILARFFEGVKTAMHGLGARNIRELYENATLYPIAKAASKGTL